MTPDHEQAGGVDLLPCPFCGGRAHLESGEASGENIVPGMLFQAFVSCENRITCSASVSCVLNDEADARQKVAEAWHRRFGRPVDALSQSRPMTAEEAEIADKVFWDQFKPANHDEDAAERCVTHHWACDCREARFARMESALSEAWGLIFAMEGQETWDRAQDWLRTTYDHRPVGIAGTEWLAPKEETP